MKKVAKLKTGKAVVQGATIHLDEKLFMGGDTYHDPVLTHLTFVGRETSTYFVIELVGLPGIEEVISSLAVVNSREDSSRRMGGWWQDEITRQIRLQASAADLFNNLSMALTSVAEEVRKIKKLRLMPDMPASMTDELALTSMKMLESAHGMVHFDR